MESLEEHYSPHPTDAATTPLVGFDNDHQGMSSTNVQQVQSNFQRNMHVHMIMKLAILFIQ